MNLWGGGDLIENKKNPRVLSDPISKFYLMIQRILKRSDFGFYSFYAFIAFFNFLNFVFSLVLFIKNLKVFLGTKLFFYIIFSDK